MCLKMWTLCCYTIGSLQDRNWIFPSSKDWFFYLFFFILPSRTARDSEEQRIPTVPRSHVLLSNRHLKRSLGNTKSLVHRCFFATLPTLKGQGHMSMQAIPGYFSCILFGDCETLLPVFGRTGNWAWCAPYPLSFAMFPTCPGLQMCGSEDDMDC